MRNKLKRLWRRWKYMGRPSDGRIHPVKDYKSYKKRIEELEFKKYADPKKFFEDYKLDDEKEMELEEIE